MDKKPKISKTSKLSPEEQEVALRLGARFDEMKKRTGMTKAAFAREFKFPGGASMISQNISGHRPISLDAAVVYMKGFECSIADISPTLAAQLPKVSQASGNLAPLSASPPTAQAATPEQLMKGLAVYLEQMDDYARRHAADVLRSLTEAPEEHARAAAMFSTAFQSGKRKSA